MMCSPSLNATATQAASQPPNMQKIHSVELQYGQATVPAQAALGCHHISGS